MGRGIFVIRHDISVLTPQLRVEKGNSSIYGDSMAVVVRRVMRQGPESKRVVVDVVGIAQQRLDEVAGSNVVNQVAEKLAAERIVAHVLDGASAIGKWVG